MMNGFKCVLFAAVAAAGFLAHGKTCTWVGTSESASLAENWSDSALPESGDAIVLDSTSSANMNWDLKSVVPASWTQTADYAGKVTFATTYAENDFPVFKVSGDVVINGGTWTHLANPNASAKSYLLRVEATGDFTIGASAKIDVSVLGYKLGGPGDYTDSTDKYGERGASYGGIAGNNSTAQGPDSPRYKGQEACYGSIKHPLDPGSGAGGQYAKTTGGGIAFVTCGGTMTIDGEIAADGNKNSIYGGSGGSILLTAGKVVGDGYVHANALDCTHAGGGGRISIIQNGAGETYFGEGENVTGRVEAMSPQGKSGAGTIYQEIAADEGLGTLFVRMPSGVKGGKDYDTGKNDAAAYTEFSTNMTGYAENPDDWKFGKIVLGNNPRISVCTGATLDLSETEVVGDATTPFAIRGTVLFGTGDVVLPTLCWHLRGESGTQFGVTMESLTLPAGATITLDRKLSVPGDLIVRSGATLTHRAGETRWLDLSVAGDMTIEEGAVVTADGTGYTKETGLDYSTAQEGKAIHGNYFKPGHASCGLNLNDRGDYKGCPPINEPLPPAYGSIISPTNHGSASFEAAGGGVIRLAATGALTIDGCVTANGLDAQNCAGAGGSVWLKAATMTMGESARISADGGRMTNMGGAYSGGSGGRVSLVLTNPAADFANVAQEYVTAYGCAAPDNYGFTDWINACGTVYFQTGAEESGSGTIIIAGRARYQGKKLLDTCAPRAMTPIPSTMLCDPNELKKPKLIVRTNASVGIQTDMKLGDLQVEDDQCLLDLGGHVLNIGTKYHAYKSAGIINAGEWIDGKKPGYANIQWRSMGLVIMVE